MSKAFDYTVITKIKNRDFLMYQKGLDTQSLDALCSKIDAFLCGNQYNEACQNLRIANENITRYLYTRLVKRNMPNDVGTIMALSALRKKFNEDTDALQGITLITHLENLHKPLNKYHHPESVTAADAQADANIYSLNFVNMLEILVPYVNERLVAIEPSLKIEYKFEPKFNESGKKYYLQELRANLQNVDNRSKYQYSWYYDRTGSEEYELLQPGNYYYKLAGQKWLIGKCIKLTATNSESGHTLNATYGPISSEQVEYGSSRTQETTDSGNSVTTSLELTGCAKIEPNLKAKEYDSLLLMVSSLDASNIDLQQQGIHYQWGFVKTDGSIFPLYNGRIFRCDPEKGVGKKYRCEITCDGFDGKIVSNDYGPISKSDFDIPLIGIASIAAEICNKEPYHNDLVLKVSFIESNINGKPNYTWVYGGTRNNSGSDSRHIISEADVGTEFTCEISHPKRKGTIIAGPFLVTSDTIKELTEKSLKQNGADRANVEENESASKPSEEETVEQDVVSVTEPIQHNDISVSERKPVHHAMPKSFDGHATAIYQNNELFNSLGKIYYFVCNDSERFILNSLEEVSYRDYLYQLLREQGYDRVVIVCDEEELHRVYAFDDETKNAVVNSSTSSSPLGGMLRKKVSSAEKTAEKEAASSCHIGARIITEIISEKVKTSIGGSNHVTFSQFVNTYLRKLIVDSKIKTAIAMPISLLKRDMNESLANDIRQKLDASKGNNIIVLTANTLEDLGDVLSLADSFGTLDSDIKKARGITQNRAVSHYCAVSAVLEGYDDEERKEKNNRKSRLIEVHPNMEADEVANYICRQKYIEQDSLFDNLQPYEVHSLAEKVIECTRDNHVQPTFTAIYQHFAEESKREAIFKLMNDGTLWPRIPVPAENLPSTALPRVMKCADRFAVSDEERAEMFAEASSELERMIGLESVKETVRQIYKANSKRKSGISSVDPGRYIFSGNPGTGKTEVARQMGKLLKAAGVLKSGHFVEVKMGDIVGEHYGEAERLTKEKCTEALGGVLFLDEAYELINRDSSKTGKFASDYAERVYKTIMNFMYDQHKSDLCVIFAGYPNEMELFQKADPGMKRRITKTINFPDYSDSELMQILESMAEKKGYKISSGYWTAAQKALLHMKRSSSHFGNAGEVDELLKASIQKWESEDGDDQDNILTEEHLPAEYRFWAKTTEQMQADYEQAMTELENMIGLKPVKEQINKLFITILGEKKRNPMATDTAPGHYVFSGNPGTGKTDVAKKMGKIFKALNLLTKDTVEVVKAPDLLAGYVGQTAAKTEQILEKAKGGVLFIDEAYALTYSAENGSESFKQDAYLKLMTYMDEHKYELCVIFAGYEKDMDQFLRSNSGMRRRVTRIIRFPDYTDEELVEIVRLMAQNRDNPFECDASLEEKLPSVFAHMRKSKGKEFGNAGEMVNLVAELISQFYIRHQSEELTSYTLTADDIPTEYLGGETIVKHPIYKRIPAKDFLELPNPFEITFPSEDTVLGPETEKTILFVKTDRGAGTAFLISPDGYALTCAHVIADKETSKEYGNYRARMLLDAHYETRTEMWFDFEVVNMNVNVDMALIHLHCDMEQNEFLQAHFGGTFPYIKLAETAKALKKGSKCIEQGYPFGDTMANDSSQDPVSIKSFQRDPFGEYISLAGEAKCGNSGSPVISLETGLVVGVVNGSITNKNDKLTEEVNYMRPIQYFWSEFTN